jgi:hypothetical protein
VTRLIPVPEEVQLPSPTSSEDEAIPVPPPRAVTPGRQVSGQRCWTRRKVDQAPGAGASGQLFWRASCQGHSSLDAPSELNPPQRIPSPLFVALLVPQAEG